MTGLKPRMTKMTKLLVASMTAIFLAVLAAPVASIATSDTAEARAYYHRTASFHTPGGGRRHIRFGYRR